MDELIKLATETNKLLLENNKTVGALFQQSSMMIGILTEHTKILTGLHDNGIKIIPSNGSGH